MNYDPEKKPFFSAAFCRFSGVIIFFSFSFFFSNEGFGTWKHLAQFLTTVNSSFFFNEQRGFIGTDGANGIWRTSDGGKTWLNCTIPSGFNGYITDIFMKDSVNGWVAIENDNVSHGLWFTTDGGISWQVNLSVTGQFSSVYQTPSGLIIADRFGPNKLSLSTDGGITFTHVGGDTYTGINFTDNLHGVATTYNGTAVFTNDGGLSWKKTVTVTTEAWGVYAQKGTSTFVIAGERNATDASPIESVFASNDYGATWQTIGTLFGRTTGHVAGVGSVIYTQSWTKWQFPNSSGFVGMNRSTDGGITWNNVGGPSNYRDTRFSVTGCNGAVVYAFDESGGVWKTTDGGDGLIHQDPHSPNLNPNLINLFAQSCSSVSASLTYSNLSCNTLKIESISFSDSTLPIISSGALSFSRYPKLPQILGSASSDSLVFMWNPQKLGIQNIISKTSIKVHGSFIGSTAIFDTVLIVSAATSIEPSSYPDSMLFPQIKIGRQKCSTFYLKNSALSGSPSFILESAKFSNNDTAFKISSVFPILPASVAAQDSLTLGVCFVPHDTSRHFDSLVLKTDCFSFSISLYGRGSTGLIFATDLDFGSVHIGDTLCKNILIKNIGSAPFMLTKLFLLSDTINFSVHENKLPLSLNAGDSVQIEVCFHPKAESTFNATIDWQTDLDASFAHSVKSNSVLSGRGAPQAGVKSTGALNSFQIFPNPTQNELDIHFQVDVAQKARVEIFDAVGKKVFADERYLLSGMNFIHLDTRNLSSGIYLLRIGEARQNFVKEK